MQSKELDMARDEGGSARTASKFILNSKANDRHFFFHGATDLSEQ
jgi:hypothetical protein